MVYPFSLHNLAELICLVLQTVVLFYRIVAGLRRFAIGLIYLTVYTVLQPKVKENFLITEEYRVGLNNAFNCMASV